MIIELEKISEFEVLYNGIKLPIVDKNKPCGASVNLEKYVDINKWQHYKKISELELGLNMVELKPSKVALTKEEQERIAELQAEIDAIKENAKQRAKEAKPPKPTKLEKMSAEQLKQEIAKCTAILAKLENKSEIE